MTRIDVTLEEARALILDAIAPLEEELAPLADALDRVIARQIVAPCALPPFANSAMDGYAVRAADIAEASREAPARLRVLSSVPAGAVAEQPVAPGAAVRIMTGAPLPPQTELVVPLEETRLLADGTVLIHAAAAAGRHLRPAGEDIQAGALALPAGQIVRPQEIGLLAALGYSEVPVVRRPRVAIISTGDELLVIGAPPAPGKIHDSNGPALAALVSRCRGRPLPLGIARDTPAALRERLRAALAQGADMILTSAGASGGDQDLVKGMLEAEGELRFCQVRMKPGRPTMFGLIGGVPLIGLPGNPAAALIAAELLARPALLWLSGRTALDKPAVRATLEQPLKRGSLRHYVRGSVRRTAEGYSASVSRGSHGAGALTGLVHANALLVVPAGRGELPAGSSVEALMLDWPEGLG